MPSADIVHIAYKNQACEKIVSKTDNNVYPLAWKMDTWPVQKFERSVEWLRFSILNVLDDPTRLWEKDTLEVFTKCLQYF